MVSSLLVVAHARVPDLIHAMQVAGGGGSCGRPASEPVVQDHSTMGRCRAPGKPDAWRPFAVQ